MYNECYIDMLCVGCGTREHWSLSMFELTKYEDVDCVGCGGNEFDITLINK
tara:strand:+ start:404 stop:556 length:153 start_codon:yes stop_codon:yes gene_type:complete